MTDLYNFDGMYNMTTHLSNDCPDPCYCLCTFEGEIPAGFTDNDPCEEPCYCDCNLQSM